MNNQIDKLMVKAGAYFGGEGIDYSNFDPKKFAELIVRECFLKMDIVYAKALVDGIEGPDTFLNGVNVSIKAVNQHFGVEE